MIPGAGLYLPESLHANPDMSSNRTEAGTMKHKYFERKFATQDKDRKLDSSRASVSLYRKSSEDVTKVFSSLSTVFDFADYATSNDKVSSDSEVFINLLQRVRQDVTEASRLHTSRPVTDYFESWPDKKTWIDAILLDIQRALNDIGVYMETVRVSGDDGGAAGLRRKFEWVLSHQKKLISKQQNLTVCHQSLMAAVQLMLTAEMNAAFNGQDPVYEAPTRPWIQEDARDVLRSPHSRQKWRLSQRNLSLPSITVSEAGRDKFDVRSVDSAPVELPGSTPDDLPLPENWDLYAPPPKPRSASMDAGPLDRPAVEPLTAVLPGGIASRPETAQSNSQISAQSPSTPLPARRSLDQVRPSISLTHQTPRASLDQQRPRANSDQVLPSTSFVVIPRASFDQVRPLPTLSEKPLERYDSNASVSVTQAATVPLTTIRHRPKAVNVKKPPVKHRSLPSTLPRFPSQTSLMDDLSNWVLPAAARGVYQGKDSRISVDTSTSSTSVTSSPASVSTSSATSCPGVVKGFGPAVVPPSRYSPTTPTTSPSVHASPTNLAYKPPLPSRLPPPVSHPAAATERLTSAQPLLEGVANNPTPRSPRNSSPPEQNTQTPAREFIIEKSVSNAENSTKPSPAVPVASPPMPPRPGTSIETTTTPPLAQTSMAPAQVSTPSKDTEASEENGRESVAKEPPVSEAKELATVSAPPTEANPPENTKIEPVKPTAPTAPAVPTTSPPATPGVSSQPMTAQARRRAAHARRMQLAFGTEKDKAGTS
ncbi:hypothetical protein K458DRAFT_417158 [Lentithecium fluviatile CBS 122367]|uniref:Uncharacterized protein n=1 Tax=Lentithecium fluviatile CBS 122367 TaxID=1168545 RepID=A0A6G1J3G8_9PLEO|nr:hypothetical protein K458DRAFT_417158 [Lentithecium fluviatile CBS 122367]